jgi:hypothetical protein
MDMINTLSLVENSTQPKNQKKKARRKAKKAASNNGECSESDASASDPSDTFCKVRA